MRGGREGRRTRAGLSQTSSLKQTKVQRLNREWAPRLAERQFAGEGEGAQPSLTAVNRAGIRRGSAAAQRDVRQGVAVKFSHLLIDVRLASAQLVLAWQRFRKSN